MVHLHKTHIQSKEGYPTVKFHPTFGLKLYDSNGNWIGSTFSIELIDKVDTGYWKARVEMIVNVDYEDKPDEDESNLHEP